MPLPPALAARLRKRGIIQGDTQEEVIAESYDDDQAVPNYGQQSSLGRSSAYAVGCPNKNNPFHICVEFCHIHWGDGIVPESRRDEKYERRRQRMLRKYPLPSSDWKEVYDPGVGRYYYWNTMTDEVSWLSPNHPRAKITMAAPKIAKVEWDKLAYERKAREDERKGQKREPERGRFSRRRRRSVSPAASFDESEHSDGAGLDDDLTGGRGRRQKQGKKKKEIDPMDPASYSDIAPGSWSSGLEMRGDAKTGVDTTANGPLFQQRPYPAPGAILRQNKEIPSKKQPQKKQPMIGPMDPFAKSLGRDDSA